MRLFKLILHIFVNAQALYGKNYGSETGIEFQDDMDCFHTRANSKLQ